MKSTETQAELELLTNVWLGGFFYFTVENKLNKTHILLLGYFNSGLKCVLIRLTLIPGAIYSTAKNPNFRAQAEADPCKINTFHEVKLANTPPHSSHPIFMIFTSALSFGMQRSASTFAFNVGL